MAIYCRCSSCNKVQLDFEEKKLQYHFFEGGLYCHRCYLRKMLSFKVVLKKFLVFLGILRKQSNS